MPGPHDALRESTPLRELLYHYLTCKQQSPGQEWHDRVMSVGTLEPADVSKLHGHLLANGWVDTRVANDVFNTPGRLTGCYKITPDGARALQWAMKEADWEDEEQETGWN